MATSSASKQHIRRKINKHWNLANKQAKLDILVDLSKSSVCKASATNTMFEPRYSIDPLTCVISSESSSTSFQKSTDSSFQESTDSDSMDTSLSYHFSEGECFNDLEPVVSDSGNLTTTSFLESHDSSDSHVLSLKDKLRFWAVKYNVRHNAVTALLKILKSDHPELPVDSRALLCTTRNLNIVKNECGQFAYFGIKNSLMKHNLKNLCPDKIINLRINIDGLPLCKSTKTTFWPILGLIDTQDTKPFIIACYYGATKPPSINEYLKDFVNEVKLLNMNGITQNDKMFKLNITHFNCDAPARAYIKCIKPHNGYFGCEKCVQKGTPIDKNVKFLELNSEKRTDDTFTEFIQSSHCMEKSPLLDLNLGLVSQFPLDPMHLIDLGVVKKLILYWVRNGERSKNNSVRICFRQISQISDILISLSKNVPSEFSRKPRSLKDIDRWKASELRQFVLYTGPVVLKNIIPDNLYIHFLCLHVAVSVLSNSELCTDEKYIKFAEDMLKSFVEDMAIWYGNKSLVYNVHNLIHLADDVRLYGSMDNFSCYPFENCLGQVKNMLRTNCKHLAQLCKRLSEQLPPERVSKDIQWLHQKGYYSSVTCVGIEFCTVVLPKFRISSVNSSDNVIQLKNKKIMSVKHIVKNSDGTALFICKEILCNGSFFSNPCDSYITSMFKVVNESNESFLIDMSAIHCKCILSWEHKVVISLLHKLL